MSRSPSPLVLVVGMHRSGTSLLGSILAAAGLSMPGPLIQGDQHNPEGYFERADITDIQERLLIDLDRWWPGATGRLPLPVDWLCRPVTHDALDRLRGLLERERDQAQRPWAIKDPRTSLLLPLWRRLCGELGIPLRLLLALRPPAEVIHSLCRRDAGPAGMTPERAEQLWWYHNRTVLRHAAGLPLLVIDDSRWFRAGEEPRHQLSELLRFCGLEQAADDPACVERSLAQIRPEHRRSAGAAGALPVHPATLALHQALSRGDLESAGALQPPGPGRQVQQAPQRLRAVPRRLLPRGWAAAAQPRGGRAESAAWRGWFDESFYRRFYPELTDHPDPLQHYLHHGWQEGRQPHALFEPAHYLRACQARGLALPADQSPLQHFLERGLAIGLVPTPLLHAAWWSRRGGTLRSTRAPALADLHPWGGAALALADQDEGAAAALLGHWLQQGIPAADWRSISEAPGPWLRWPANPPLQCLPGGHARLPRSSSGLSLEHWLCQGWLASLGSLETGEGASGDLERLHLLLLPAGQPPEPAEVLRLGQEPGLVLVDPDPERCRCWEHLGLNWVALPSPAPERLDAYLAPRPWLETSASLLGLPDPRACPPGTILCLGSGTPSWNQADKQGIWHLPGFDELELCCEEALRALAAWLWQAHRHGLRLVCLHPQPAGEQTAWAGWLPMEWVHPFGLSAEALQAELEWRDRGRPAPPPVTTPSPGVTTLWSHDTGPESARAGVVVRLHDNAGRITQVLTSVQLQTLEDLELVVVDDASEDDSASVVLAWLERHSDRFQRALLLQHHHKGGLAATRNTALRHSRAPWCFVLDADNQLDSQAVEQCLSLALHGSERLAVVHPLIRRRLESPAGEATVADLLSRHSWQRSQFAQKGNHVNAMALIRRSAWETVGGYHHIPGGWEDFDFWCCLIDAGYHGVLCPRPLATYTVHGDSRLQSSTNRDLQRLSRLLQARHSWLNLPLADLG